MIQVTYVFLGIGAVFQALGTLALHRFPDVYTRLHGATKCTTFGSIFIYMGIIFYGLLSSIPELSVHTLVAMMLLLITNPTGAHAIARAAHRSGLLPEKAVVDKLQEERK